MASRPCRLPSRHSGRRSPKTGMLLNLAADLVRQKRDVIVSLGGDVTPAAQRATRSIPIVMNDAVQAGLGGLAQPGSNLTGVTLILDARAGNNCASPESASCGTQRARIPSSGRTISPPRLWGVPLQSLETRRAANFEHGLSACGSRARRGSHRGLLRAHEPPEPANRRLHGKASRADGGGVVTAPTRAHVHRSAAEQHPFK